MSYYAGVVKMKENGAEHSDSKLKSTPIGKCFGSLILVGYIGHSKACNTIRCKYSLLKPSKTKQKHSIHFKRATLEAYRLNMAVLSLKHVRERTD